MDIRIVRKVLEENNTLASEIRKRLQSKGQWMANFMSSPGSGKTRLLEKLIPMLKAKGVRVGVIEGDITTTNDSQRLQPLGIPIAQINTDLFGGDCHLGANVILGALDSIGDVPTDVILIENVGNLVCPAEFDTGAHANIVILSVTEGEDKPLKYPLMFRKSHIALINKIDLAEAAEADIPLIRKNIAQINPEIEILETSGKTGAGLDRLVDLLLKNHKRRS